LKEKKMLCFVFFCVFCEAPLFRIEGSLLADSKQ